MQSQVTNIGSKVFDVSKKGISDLSSMLGQRMSLYEDINSREESFDDGDFNSNGHQSYQNSDNNFKSIDKSVNKNVKEGSSLIHSSKSTPANLSAQAISREEQVLVNSNRSVKKKTEEDDVWAMLADDKPKKSNRRK